MPGADPRVVSMVLCESEHEIAAFMIDPRDFPQGVGDAELGDGLNAVLLCTVHKDRLLGDIPAFMAFCAMAKCLAEGLMKHEGYAGFRYLDGPAPRETLQ